MMNPKQIGPLFSLVGMIGTSAEQILAHSDMPKSFKRQATAVKKYADASIEQVVDIISETTVRKMDKHGHAFVSHCARQGLVRSGGESAVMVCARLMSGHYGLNHHIHRLGFRGPWRELEKTSYNLLKMCLKGEMGEYEHKLFRVAEEMISEVSA